MKKSQNSIWMDLEDLTNAIDEVISLLMTLALSVQVSGLDANNKDVSNIAYIAHRILTQANEDLLNLSEIERQRSIAMKGGATA